MTTTRTWHPGHLAHPERTRRRLRTAAGTAVGAALLLLAATPASAEPADLIEADPASVSIQAPAPGETLPFDLAVRSITDAPVPLVLTVAGHSGGLLSGPTPVEITLTDDDGRTILTTTRADQLLGTTLDLPDLAAGDGYHLAGTVTLPAAAGDEYQGADGQVVFRIQVATDVPSTDDTSGAAAPQGPAAPGGLATTGATVAAAVAAVAVLVTTGTWLVAARRRRSSDA